MAAPAGALFFAHANHNAVFVVFPNGLVRHVLGAEYNAYGRPGTHPITDETDYQNFLSLAEALQSKPVAGS